MLGSIAVDFAHAWVRDSYEAAARVIEARLQDALNGPAE